MLRRKDDPKVFFAVSPYKGFDLGDGRIQCALCKKLFPGEQLKEHRRKFHQGIDYFGHDITPTHNCGE